MTHEETPKDQIKIPLSTAFWSSRNFYYHTSHKEEHMSSVPTLFEDLITRD